MSCVEWMSIQLVERIRSGIGISEFDESVSMRFQNDSIYTTRRNLPVALSRLFVPWHRDIIRLYCGTFSCELLCDF